MADDKEVIVDETEDDSDFDAGFNAPASSTAVVAKADEPVEKTEETPEKIDDAPPAVVDEPVVVAPEYVQITKEQLARLEAAADKSGDFESQFKKVFGTLGSVQDLVKKLQTDTPKGDAITIPDDVVAEMEEDYPQLAKHVRSALEKALKGARGTGPATASVDPAEINKLVADGVKTAQLEALEDEYPDWRDIVGAVDSPEKANPENPFRKWLSTQPADYAVKVRSTHSSLVLAKAIAKFKDATKAPPPKPATPPAKVAARKARIEGAIQPKGDGNPPPPPKTGDDEFDEGYRNARRSG